MKLAFLRFCKAIGLFKVAKWAHREKLCILCYHGFAMNGESAFRPKLFMEPSTFTSRMEFLRKAGVRILSLREGIEELYSGGLRDNSVVITIDDGFFSTYSVAAPVLKSHGFPATVYVTTYYALKETPIYRLFVQYAFWKTKVTRLRQSEVGELSEDLDLTDATGRDRATWALIRYGEDRSTEEQQSIAERLGRALGVDYSVVRTNRCFSLMKGLEIRDLRRFGIDVQLHTHRHRLPSDREGVLAEIETNRTELADLVAGPLNHLCYPSGEWSAAVWPWLKEAGVISATTCDYGFNEPATHPLALRRFLDGEDVSAIEFEAGICGFSDWLQRIRDLVHRKRPDPVYQQWVRET